MIEFVVAFVLLIVLLFIEIPIAFSIGMASLVYMVITDAGNILVAPLRIFAGLNSFILMAIPLFIFAAEIMIRSKISKKMFTFISLSIGRFQGGLAYVNVLASTVFGSIAGAALSDIAGLGKIEIDAMKEDGYEPNFACAITAASAIQSPIIPPSNIAILYGGVMSLSVGALFIAGVIPGLLLALGQFAYIKVMSKKINLPRHTEVFTKKERLQIIRDGLIAMLMPVIILGGILGGLVTPTESAAVAVLYALVVSHFVFHNLTFKDIKESMWVSAKISANLFLIISFSTIFAWALGMQKVPDQIAALMLRISENPYILLLIVNVFLIIVGMWMETGAAVLLFAPILAPVMYKVGIHPIHFAMVMLINLTVGLITPPVGVVLYATTSVGNVKFEDLVRKILPLVLLGMLVVLLVTFFPELTLFLPRLAGLV